VVARTRRTWWLRKRPSPRKCSATGTRNDEETGGLAEQRTGRFANFTATMAHDRNVLGHGNRRRDDRQVGERRDRNPGQLRERDPVEATGGIQQVNAGRDEHACDYGKDEQRRQPAHQPTAGTRERVPANCSSCDHALTQCRRGYHRELKDALARSCLVWAAGRGRPALHTQARARYDYSYRNADEGSMDAARRAGR
jgi:hypothetical protein